MQLVIENLSKRYPGDIQALSNVSLTIPPGMFGLLGPNGAGKSTLMRIIATLQDADSGSVLLDDLDVLAEKDEVRKRLGYLPQDFGLYARVSAWRMINHFASLKGMGPARQRRQVCRHLLQRTNLDDVRSRPLGSFSGGMKQRFGIALALLGSPDLIIVDEPTAGLDPEERNRFLNLLGEISENVIVVLSTHIVADVNDLCAAMAIMNHGEVILAGEPMDIVGALKGRVWEKTVDKTDVEQAKKQHQVLSTRMFAGACVIHVLSDRQPDPSYDPVTPDLQDAYFCAIKQHEAEQAVGSGA